MAVALSPEAELAIQKKVSSILLTWIAALGVTNILGLAVCMAYVFVILPKQAVVEAKSAIDAQAAAESAAIHKTELDFMEKLGHLRSDQDGARKSLTEISQQIFALEALLKTATESKATAVARLIEVLSKDGNAESFTKTLLRLADELKNLKESAVMFDKAYHLHAFAGSDKYFLDVADGKHYNGGSVVIGLNKGEDQQRWMIEK